jgi:hypothetical protein
MPPKKNPAKHHSLEERYRVLSRNQEKKRWEKHRSFGGLNSVLFLFKK